MLKIANILQTNGILKINAFILAFIFWSIMSESQRSQMTISVPVCFYNMPEKCSVKAPDSIHITLSGMRPYLRSLDTSLLAVHINAKNLTSGTNVIDLTSQHLLLPPEINLVKYKPMHLIFDNLG